METCKIMASERPKELYFYEVEGVGSFPLDMLRYDAAWPRNSESVSQMNMSSGNTVDRCVVGLQSYNILTLARCLSFGWNIKE